MLPEWYAVSEGVPSGFVGRRRLREFGAGPASGTQHDAPGDTPDHAFGPQQSGVASRARGGEEGIGEHLADAHDLDFAVLPGRQVTTIGGSAAIEQSPVRCATAIAFDGFDRCAATTPPPIGRPPSVEAGAQVLEEPSNAKIRIDRLTMHHDHPAIRSCGWANHPSPARAPGGFRVRRGTAVGKRRVPFRAGRSKRSRSETRQGLSAVRSRDAMRRSSFPSPPTVE